MTSEVISEMGPSKLNTLFLSFHLKKYPTAFSGRQIFGSSGRQKYVLSLYIKPPPTKSSQKKNNE